jgi:hypothetical protein
MKAQMEEEEDNEEDNPDEELVASAVDGMDFLTQSWQHP